MVFSVALSLFVRDGDRMCTWYWDFDKNPLRCAACSSRFLLDPSSGFGVSRTTWFSLFLVFEVIRIRLRFDLSGAEMTPFDVRMASAWRRHVRLMTSSSARNRSLGSIPFHSRIEIACSIRLAACVALLVGSFFMRTRRVDMAHNKA